MALKKIEHFALTQLKKEELEHLKSETGVFHEEGRQKKGGHYGSLTLALTPPILRERSTHEIVQLFLDKAKKLVPEYEMSTNILKGGPPQGKAVGHSNFW